MFTKSANQDEERSIFQSAGREALRGISTVHRRLRLVCRANTMYPCNVMSGLSNHILTFVQVVRVGVNGHPATGCTNGQKLVFASFSLKRSTQFIRLPRPGHSKNPAFPYAVLFSGSNPVGSPLAYPCLCFFNSSRRERSDGAIGMYRFQPNLFWGSPYLLVCSHMCSTPSIE